MLKIVVVLYKTIVVINKCRIYPLEINMEMFNPK